MKKTFFSLLWDSETYYQEWLRDKETRDKEFIYDLNLQYIYEEVRRLGGFGDRYDFRDIFLYSCAAGSTVAYRQRIMERLYENPELYEAALEAVSCISDSQSKLERVCGTKDELKKKIFFLHMLYEFLLRMAQVYSCLEKLISAEKLCALGISKAAEEITGQEAVERMEKLRSYLQLLQRITPDTIVMNKGENQICHSAVVWPEEEEKSGYMDRLMELVSFFLDDCSMPVKVYQDMDITCFDKKLQEYICRQQPEFPKETEMLYQAYRKFDFWPYIKLANELVFYLSCIRFRKEYEQEEFYFTVPKCQYGEESKVTAAYDMVLGINLFRKNKGCKAVPNDFRFDRDGRFFLLTGANQGGKTTFIRSIGLVQHLAQIGMFVPAKGAVVGMVRHIHTHFGRDDEAAAMVGRFEQELERMRKLLNDLRDGDMVLLNETFTSTQRMGAVILLGRLLKEFDRKHCVGGLVTHYHEIYDRLEEGSFYSLTAGVEEESGRMDRTFKIIRSDSGRQSYAKDIAVKCGVTYDQLVGVLKAAEEGGDLDVLF